MSRRRLAPLVLAVFAVGLASAADTAPAATVNVTGEIVDSACWIKSGAKGESHRTCAQKCADAGIPLALVEDGTGTLVWLASVADMETPNKQLRPHAGRRVTVTGSWAERGGAKILLVTKVAPAAP